MNLCNKGHEEVCFEGRKCPACEAMKELQSDIDSRDNDIVKLENQIGDMEARIKDLEAELETGEV